jgi:hypothetical protein
VALGAQAHPVVRPERCIFELVRESLFHDGAVAARPKPQVSSARRDRGSAHSHGIVSSAGMDGIPTHARSSREAQGSSHSRVETGAPRAAPQIAGPHPVSEGQWATHRSAPNLRRARVDSLLRQGLPAATADAHVNPENASGSAGPMPQEQAQKLPHH